MFLSPLSPPDAALCAVNLPSCPAAAAKAFFTAVSRGDLSTVALLLRAGCVDVNCANCLHKTALFMATEAGDTELARLLIDSGADANLASFCSAYSVYEAPAVTAARVCAGAVLQLVLARGARARQAEGGKTALQWAATHGDTAGADLLLRHGADIDALGPYCNTALHYAATAERADTVAWLLRRGASVSINHDGRTALHVAAVRGSLQTVGHLLAAGCEVDVRDRFRFTPFSLACLRGHFDVLQYLVEHSAPGTYFDIDDGLLKAADSGHVDIVTYLLSRGASVDGVNTSGESALSLAAKGQPVCVALLLRAGAAVDVVDKRGYTPLQAALLRERVDIATSLLRHGAWPRPAVTAAESPLHMAFTCSRPLLLKMLLLVGGAPEPWLNAAAVAQKLAEVDFHTPRLPAQQARQQKDAWAWTVAFARRPRTLLQACRVAVRAALSTATGGSSIEAAVDRLPLPPCVTRYVALTDVFAEQ